MPKPVYNYLKYELEHLEENWEKVERFAEGELVENMGIKIAIRIIKIKKATIKAEKYNKKEHKIEIIAKELGFVH